MTPRFIAIRLPGARFIAASLVAVLVAAMAPRRVDAPGRAASFPLAGRVVVVDPGHGGIDPGCHLGDATEKEISLDVGLLLAAELRAQGGDVFVTRTQDVELSPYGRTQRTRHGRDLEARVLLAEAHGGHILVSLHVNAAKSERMGGGMVFYQPGSPESRLLAQSILAHLREVTPGNQNASLPADFYVLRHSKMPAVLVEMGFLTHRGDREILLSGDGRRRLAQAIARGIAEYLGGASGDEAGKPPGADEPGRAPAAETAAPVALTGPGEIGGAEPGVLDAPGGHECPLVPGWIPGVARGPGELTMAWAWRSSGS